MCKKYILKDYLPTLMDILGFAARLCAHDFAPKPCPSQPQEVWFNTCPPSFATGHSCTRLTHSGLRSLCCTAIQYMTHNADTHVRMILLYKYMINEY